MNPAAVNLTAEPPGPAEVPGDEYELGPLGERFNHAARNLHHSRDGLFHRRFAFGEPVAYRGLRIFCGERTPKERIAYRIYLRFRNAQNPGT